MSEDLPRAQVAPGGPPTSPPQETVKTRRLTAVLNGASALLIMGAVCAVLVAATPSLVRTLLSRGRSVTVLADADHLMPHPRGGADEPVKTPARTPHGTFRHDRDDLPVPALPGDRTHPFEGDDPGVGEPAEESAPGEEGRSKSIRLGLARKTLTLYAEPGGAGEVLGEIKAGEQVVIIKEAGPWALVFQSGNMGWTKKSEIAVR